MCACLIEDIKQEARLIEDIQQEARLIIVFIQSLDLGKVHYVI